MKNRKSILALSVFLVSTSVAAQDSTSPEKTKRSHPCKTIATACEAAGFIRHGHKDGKGLWKDCFHPLMAGKAVSGVTISPTEIQACQAKKSKRASEKQNH